jgi:CheY-like chemotaxis protein
MKRLRILVVEDDGIVAFLLGQVLEGMGYEVCAIESDEAGAVAAAARCKPDLMIVDENLGRGSGLVVMDDILLNGPMAHIFVSGDTTRILEQTPGAIVLEKPYFEADLEQAIWRALARPRNPSDHDPIEPMVGGAESPPLAHRRCV